jgi:uncharacterized repeat protein (TIGR03803 family)
MLIRRLLLCCLLPSLADAQPVQPVQLVHAFTASPSRPDGALVPVADGSLYGLTPTAIYRLAPDGQVTIAARLTDGFDAQGSLVRGPDGALYGTTQRGGLDGHGTVFRFDLTTSEVRTIHAFTGANEGATPFGGLTLVGSLLYGVTRDRPASGVVGGTIFQIDPGTGTTVTRHVFLDQPAPAAWLPTGRPVPGPDGMLYGTTLFLKRFGGRDLSLRSEARRRRHHRAPVLRSIRQLVDRPARAERRRTPVRDHRIRRSGVSRNDLPFRSCDEHLRNDLRARSIERC